MEKPAWFRDLFGFDESSTWEDNVNHFHYDHIRGALVCRTAPQFPRQHIGRFECPSVAELRSKLAAAQGAAAPSASLSFAHLAAPAGVGPLHREPSNAGAVFQAASQFNCLEMTNPSVSPTDGVGIYINDRTQGFACALACPAATVYRNYLVQHEGNTGQHPVQIDNLKAVGVAVGNGDGRYWVMQNGYALPVGRDSLTELAARLRTEPNLVEEAEAALRVGVHWETSVAPPLEHHRVCQVYASALPCAYAHGTPESDWEPFARLVLRAAYEATLAVGAVRSLGARGARVKCYLTALGGGVFGNRYEWIRDAISHALDLYQGWPLDVVLVHYGSRVDANWVHDLAPRQPAPRQPVPTKLGLYGELEHQTLGAVRAAGKRMGDVVVGARALAALIEKNTTLKELDLSRARMRSGAAIALALGGAALGGAPAAADKAAWSPHKPTFYFLSRAAVLSATATQLKRMQELRDSKLLEKMAVDLNEAFQGKGLVQNVLFVSHRWEDSATPDETGAQLAALKAHLMAHPEVQYIWFDYACMPQRSESAHRSGTDDRTPAEKAEFDLMLKAIADLYLTAKVLILLDTAYRTRFWTTMEGWCAMQQVTSDGVRPAREGESRVTVSCIHNATEKDREALLEMSTKTPAEMSKFLASPDVFVTNKKDKETMLPIVGETDEHVREMMSGMHGR
jgi:hypothetical protein